MYYVNFYVSFCFLLFCVMLDKYVLRFMGKKWNKGGAGQGCFKKQKAHWGGCFTLIYGGQIPAWFRQTPSDTLK